MEPGAARAGAWGAAGGSGSGSDVLPAVGAQDVVPLREEASPHQRQRALLAVKAVVVPLPLLEGDVLGAAQSCGRRTRTRVRTGGGAGGRGVLRGRVQSPAGAM